MPARPVECRLQVRRCSYRIDDPQGCERPGSAESSKKLRPFFVQQVQKESRADDLALPFEAEFGESPRQSVADQTLRTAVPDQVLRARRVEKADEVRVPVRMMEARARHRGALE